MSNARPLKLLYCPSCGTPLHVVSYRILECPACDEGYDLDEVDYTAQEPVHFLEVPAAPDPGFEVDLPSMLLPEEQYVYCERQTGKLIDRLSDRR
jgi:uncharacterized protein YbaR (Trm112 family)